MRILVTGGAGYLGRVFCARAKACGHKVFIVDTCLYAADGGNALFTEFAGRRQDFRFLRSADLQAFDAVVHLAAISNDPTADYAPAQTRAINVDGSERLVQLMADAGVHRCVFASTASIYDGCVQPGEIAVETSIVHPTALYSATKFEAEMCIRRQRGIGAMLLRFGTLYGPSERMRFDLVANAFVRAAISAKQLTIYGDGKNRRPILDVRDAAEAILDALKIVEPGSIATYNVVGENITIGELAAHVCEIAERYADTGAVVRTAHAPAPERSRDYAAAGDAWARRTGRAPQYDVRATIAELYDGLRTWGQERLFDPRSENITWLREIS